MKLLIDKIINEVELEMDPYDRAETEGEAGVWAMRYPPGVREIIKQGAPVLWPAAMQRAIEAGIRDSSKLADLAFFMHHPDRNGRAIDSSEPGASKLIALWKFLRDAALNILKGSPTHVTTSEKVGPVPAVETLLPRSGIGFVATKPQSRQYGLPETIQALKEIGRRWHALYQSGPPIQISDISRRGGGHLAPHGAHRIGNDVDIRFIKKDGKLGAVNPLIKSQKPNFDLPRTQDLINIIQANGVLKVHRLWVNKWIGLTNINGDEKHNDHMHVRFCVPARYDLRVMRHVAKVSPGGTYSTC
jgi:hypothetical protein